MKKVRVRFGLRLSWPIANAGIVVMRQVNDDQFLALLKLVGELKVWLTLNGHDDIARRIVCESS